MLRPDPSLETEVEFAGDEKIDTHSGDGHIAPFNVASLFKSQNARVLVSHLWNSNVIKLVLTPLLPFEEYF